MASVAAAPAKSGKKCLVAVAMVGRLLLGAATTVLQKVQYSTVSLGLHSGMPRPFRKPIFMCITAQTAMMLIGLLGTALRRSRGHRGDDDSAAANRDGPTADTGAHIKGDMETGAGVTADPPRAGRCAGALDSYWRKICLTAMPAAFGLFSDLLMNVALLYLPASINHMLRASGIVFTALLSACFLNKRITCGKWCGVAICCFGVTLAGASGFKGIQVDELHSMLIAIALALLSQFIAAMQMVAEEALIKNLDLAPLELLAWEGLWGLTLVLGVIQPVASHVPGQDSGHLEGFLDTLAMLAHNPNLLSVQVALLFVMGTSAFLSLVITTLLNSVHRKIVSCCGSIPIWVFGLVAFYGFGQHSGFGEAWTSLSLLQLAGFVMILSGQALYGGLLRLPRCFRGGSEDEGPASNKGKDTKLDGDDPCTSIEEVSTIADAETASISSWQSSSKISGDELSESSDTREP